MTELKGLWKEQLTRSTINSLGRARGHRPYKLPIDRLSTLNRSRAGTLALQLSTLNYLPIDRSCIQ
ncbi:MAG: hypothetical protein ACRC62_06935 [Microcoleus sp.]